MTRVLVATTMAAYKAMPDRDEMESTAWLMRAERHSPDDVEYLAVLQTGQGHDDAFKTIREHMAALDGHVWTFSLDDGSDSITSGSRLAAICTGRNLAHEFVNRRPDFTHLLLLDSDVEPAGDTIEKLLEVRWPVVGGHIPTYCMDGPRLSYKPAGGDWWQLEGSQDQTASIATQVRRFPDGADVREHWSSAGCWMLTREAVNRIRWGWSLDEGATDDPWTADLARRVGLGPMWVRHDVVCPHHPGSIEPVEKRGHDLSVIR